MSDIDDVQLKNIKCKTCGETYKALSKNDPCPFCEDFDEDEEGYF